MSAAPFIDTNILLYAHLDDPAEARHARALALLQALDGWTLSTQVLAEYFNGMARHRVPQALITSNIETLVALGNLRVVTLDVIRLAWKLKARYGFSYWDSQLVASALDAGCTTLYTEDLQHGQVIEGRLTVVNPLSE